MSAPILTDEDFRLLQEKELANAISKLNSGGSLTSHERKILAAAHARSKEAAAGADFILTAETAGPKTSRSQIAARYADENGEPLSLRTIDRLNRIGDLPDVATPPPWNDPPTLAEWYRVHYRSDPSKPAPKNPKSTLPTWLSSAVARHQSAPSPDPQNTPPPPPEEPEFLGSNPLEFARSLLRIAEKKYNLVRHNPAEEPAARRAWLETLEKVQQAEDRARKAGNSTDLPRERVAEIIDRIHNRILRRLIADLRAARGEAARCATSPEEWHRFAEDFIHATCSRLVNSRFADLAETHANAAA